MRASQPSNSAVSRAMPRGSASAGCTVSATNCACAACTTASCNASLLPKWANSPLFDRLLAAARLPMVSPLTPTWLASASACCRIASLVAAFFVIAACLAAVFVQNSTIVLF
jgi:hypothetical protein